MPRTSEADHRRMQLTELYILYCRAHNYQLVWGSASESNFMAQHAKSDLAQLRTEMESKIRGVKDEQVGN